MAINFISTVGEGAYYVSNPGLLRRSSDIRDAMLSMNVGKYRLFDEALLPAIGEVANVHEHDGNVPLYAYESDDGLVDYRGTVDEQNYYFNNGQPERINIAEEGVSTTVNPWYDANAGYLTERIANKITGESIDSGGATAADDVFYVYKQRELSNLRDRHSHLLKGNGRFTNGNIAYTLHPEIDWHEGRVADVNLNDVNGDGYSIVDGTEDYIQKPDLYSKTSKLFNEKKIDSIINRFYAGNQESSQIQTGVSSYGLSRGRNLLKKEPTIHNGYYNPYCRVWTSHYQYMRTTDAIRPFSYQDSEGNGHFSSIGEVQGNYGYFRPNAGAERLSRFTVLQKNGRPRITPTQNPETIKRCMFSIENLAWRDLNLSASTKSADGKILGPTLTPEQIGPNGGRIMWFPPYGLEFSESSNPNWNSNDIMGRGEKIYTYTNTERTGNLSFMLLVDHPSIVDRIGKDNDSQGEAKEALEQSLLRHFAGCGYLDPNDYYLSNSGSTESTQSENEKVVEPTSTPREEARKNNYYCYIFFPNDFSGVNLTADDAMSYLYQGMGVSAARSYDNDKKVYDSNGALMYPKGYEMGDSGISIFSGDKATKSNPTDLYNKNDLKGTIANGHGQYWGYLVDDKYKKEILSGRTDSVIGSYNYADRKSFKLNSDTEVVRKWFGLTDDDKLYSFKDFYDILTEKGQTLNDFLSAIGGDYRITVNGFANIHGHEPNNESLHTNRAKTVKRWLDEFFDSENVVVGENETITLSEGNDDVNLKESKAARCAKITISFDDSDVDIKNADTSDIRLDRTGTLNTSNMVRVDNGSEFITYVPVLESPARVLSATEMSNDRKAYKAKIAETKTEIVEKSDNVYDNEYLYFRDLKENDPVTYSKVTDKLKYFDPAFHSITPEGFNARLTFLHQCTRQGPTQSHSDGSGSASNLAFGRAPYCVLRIGDFYNTRIAITSLSIDFNDAPWDFNSEGIGVQPMMAKVTIGFTFVGGSDLSGPISRLQNAVSFNYYGNASVYDRRADFRNSEIYREQNNSGDTESTTTRDSYYVWNPARNVSGRGENAGPQYKLYSTDYK